MKATLGAPVSVYDLLLVGSAPEAHPEAIVLQGQIARGRDCETLVIVSHSATAAVVHHWTNIKSTSNYVRRSQIEQDPCNPCGVGYTDEVFYFFSPEELTHCKPHAPLADASDIAPGSHTVFTRTLDPTTELQR